MKKVDLLKLNDMELDKAVKIKDTDFNRNHKLTHEQIKAIRKAFNKGTSITKLAEQYGVAYPTIKRHVDESFRLKVNADRKLYASYITTTNDLHERAQYKRQLIQSGKIK